jgi:predicted RNase H-like nuclease
MAAHGDASAIGVDMPIGYPATDRRPADVAARAFLGRRASSVFFTPTRAVLTAVDYAAANALSKRTTTRGISAQSFALRTKILEIESIAAADARLYEVHPEVSFAALAGGPLSAGKKSWTGQMERRALLIQAGIVIPDALPAVGRAAPDDVLDAAVAAWSAARIARGEAQSLPDPPEMGPEGRPIAIWY